MADLDARDALDLWFCPACGALLSNSNYKVDETQKCRGKRHRMLAVKRRYVLAACEDTERPEREALLAYALRYPCPGIVVEGGDVSGCEGPLHDTDDCPTCETVTKLGVQDTERPGMVPAQRPKEQSPVDDFLTPSDREIRYAVRRQGRRNVAALSSGLLQDIERLESD